MTEVRSEIETKGNFEDVYALVKESAVMVGKLKQELKVNGTIVVKTRMKFFPSPINAVKLIITVKEMEPNVCSIRFTAQCYDGAIGLDSPNRVLEKVYAELFRRIG